MNLGHFLFEYNHLRKQGGLNYETPFDKLQKVTELLSQYNGAPLSLSKFQFFTNFACPPKLPMLISFPSVGTSFPYFALFSEFDIAKCQYGKENNWQKKQANSKAETFAKITGYINIYNGIDYNVDYGDEKQ